MRRPKTNRVERTRAGNEWTEAAFWGFLRSGLRQMSRRWPPIARLALHAARRPYRGDNKRRKWEYLCAACGTFCAGDEVAVDHVDPCGSIRSWDEFATFAARLFVECEGLRVLCHECHQLEHERRTT